MNQDIVKKITDFLISIGLGVEFRPISGESFLQGLQIEQGKLVIDRRSLLYPGDILHEAGHLATMPPSVRITMTDPLENNDLNRGGEMMAISWSYAVCKHLDIDPAIVFHAAGYKGGSEHLLQSFADGYYLALPLLQWAGMTYEPKKAKELNREPFPKMTRWLREE